MHEKMDTVSLRQITDPTFHYKKHWFAVVYLQIWAFWYKCNYLLMSRPNLYLELGLVNL